MDRLQENGEIARLVSEVKDGVDQIQSYGCICKGAEQGLVDFRACWEQKWSFYAGNRVNRRSAIGTGLKRFCRRRPLLDAEKTGPEKNFLPLIGQFYVSLLLLLVPFQSVFRLRGFVIAQNENAPSLQEEASKRLGFELVGISR